MAERPPVPTPTTVANEHGDSVSHASKEVSPPVQQRQRSATPPKPAPRPSQRRKKEEVEMPPVSLINTCYTSYGEKITLLGVMWLYLLLMHIIC